MCRNRCSSRISPGRKARNASSSNTVLRAASLDCSTPSPLQSNLPTSTPVIPTPRDLQPTRHSAISPRPRPHRHPPQRTQALDDKMILTEVHPLESLPRHRQFPTAKAALTPLWPRTRSTARLCSNFQAVLDLRSGILHAEDTDYTTASSYFFERFEKLSAQGMRVRLGRLSLCCSVGLR